MASTSRSWVRPRLPRPLVAAAVLFDYEALTTHLLAIKQEYPKSDTMILTPETGIDYGAMIRTMDAARETQVKVAGATHVIPVFPTVVVSTIIK